MKAEIAFQPVLSHGAKISHITGASFYLITGASFYFR